MKVVSTGKTAEKPEAKYTECPNVRIFSAAHETNHSKSLPLNNLRKLNILQKLRDWRKLAENLEDQ